MKLLFIYFFLFIVFQSSAKTDDIRDFEIEEISIGDSLLNYYSQEVVEEAYDNASYYKDETFAVLFIPKNSKNYDKIQVTIKPTDKSHKIFGIDGVLYFDDNIDECNKKKQEIVTDLEKIFTDFNKVDNDDYYTADPTKNSFDYGTWFFFNSGGFVSVNCTKMGKEVREKNGWRDQLAVSVTSKVLEKFLSNSAY